MYIYFFHFLSKAAGGTHGLKTRLFPDSPIANAEGDGDSMSLLDATYAVLGLDSTGMPHFEPSTRSYAFTAAMKTPSPRRPAYVDEVVAALDKDPPPAVDSVAQNALVRAKKPSKRKSTAKSTPPKKKGKVTAKAKAADAAFMATLTELGIPQEAYPQDQKPYIYFSYELSLHLHGCYHAALGHVGARI